MLNPRMASIQSMQSDGYCVPNEVAVVVQHSRRLSHVLKQQQQRMSVFLGGSLGREVERAPKKQGPFWLLPFLCSGFAVKVKFHGMSFVFYPRAIQAAPSFHRHIIHKLGCVIAHFKMFSYTIVNEENVL